MPQYKINIPDLTRELKVRGIVDDDLEVERTINHLSPNLRRLAGATRYEVGFFEPLFLSYYKVEDAIYRRDLHSLLLEDKEFRLLFSGLHGVLPPPKRPDYVSDIDSYNGRTVDTETIRKRMLRIKKFMDMPETLERMAELPSEIEAVRDMRKFALKSRKMLSDYAQLVNPLKEELARGIKQDPPNMDYANDCLKKIEPFLDLLIQIRDIRKPIHDYLILCVPYEQIFNGERIPSCKPEFLDPEERRGEILSAYNPSKFKFGRSEDKKRIEVIKLSIPNDIIWGENARNTFIHGPNSLGKSFYMRTIGLNVHLPMAGLRPFAKSCLMSPVDRIFPCFDLGDSLNEEGERHWGHFLTGAQKIIELRKYITPGSLALLDETGGGTEPEAETWISNGLSNALIRYHFTSFCITHDKGAWRKYQARKGVKILRVADLDDKRRRFQVWPGVARGGYGKELAKRKGIDPSSIKNALASRV